MSKLLDKSSLFLALLGGFAHLHLHMHRPRHRWLINIIKKQEPLGHTTSHLKSLCLYTSQIMQYFMIFSRDFRISTLIFLVISGLDRSPFITSKASARKKKRVLIGNLVYTCMSRSLCFMVKTAPLYGFK